jgi:formate--tetrahydrofolate ligase
VTAWVEREGVLRPGDTLRLHVPDQRPWAHLEAARGGPPGDGGWFRSETPRRSGRPECRKSPRTGGGSVYKRGDSPAGGTAMSHKSDIEIARAATKKPILEIGAKLGIPAEDLLPYGHDKAKVGQGFIAGLKDRPMGKLILVTAINPTPAGEGKTTTTVGLGDGLNRIGKKAVVCIREASLGPNFGMKGGAAGGGYAQVVPMEEMNLHFTGDFHAITAAHNLLSAMIDNHIYWGNALDIDTRRVVWRRVMDMNDRALREVVASLGGVANGFPRQTGFDITVASEVMAILCLATDLKDLEKRLGDMIVAYRRDKLAGLRARPQGRRGDDGASEGRDAAEPRADAREQPGLRAWRPLRQHRAWLQFGHRDDDGAAACRFRGDGGRVRRGPRRREVHGHQVPEGGLAPDCVVVVATVRALKMNGGVAKADLGAENVEAVTKGCENLARHIDNLKGFGVPVVVAINHFVSDTEAEVAAVKAYAQAHGAEAFLCKHWAQGSPGSRNWPRGWPRSPMRACPTSARSTPTRWGCSRRSRPSPRRSTGRARSWRTARSGRS